MMAAAIGVCLPRFSSGSGRLRVAALLLFAACGGRTAGVGDDNGSSGSSSGGPNGSSGSLMADSGVINPPGEIFDPPGIGVIDPTGNADGGPTDNVGANCATTTTGGSGMDDAGASVPTCPKGAAAICHELYANDNGRHRLNYVNEFTGDRAKGFVIWSVGVGETTTANSPRTIEIVDNCRSRSGKAVLVSLETGYAEFDTTDGTKLAQVSGYSGISGACRLPDGNTALGQDNTIIIVSPTGARVRNIILPQGDNLRAINRNPANGHFWFSKTSIIYEIDDQGGPVWQGNLGAGTKGYSVWWRERGGAYAATGDPATIVEMDATGTIVSTVGGKGMMFPYLDFLSGFVRLTNGNYVVANWLGQLASPSPTFPNIVEFAAPCGSAPGPCANPKNEIVWQWGSQMAVGQVTNIFVLR